MMKKILLVAALLSAMVFSGCEYHIGGAKAFNATSELEGWQDSVKYYGIQYISPDVYGVMYSDFYRSKGFFAYNVKDNGDKISYTRLDDDYSRRLKLKPDYNWWQSYGIWISLLLLVAYLLIQLMMNSD